MATLLLIETATEVCSVAISRDGNLVTEKRSEEPNAHSSHLTLLIEACIQETGMSYQQLQGVCVSRGPGSYTGLRIGTSAAKGLCYSLDIPLLSVSTLQSMAAGVSADANTLIMPMIDARRQEVYTCLYDSSASPLTPESAVVLDQEDPFSAAKNHPVCITGSGAAKCKILYPASETRTYQEKTLVSAEFMALLAETRYQQQDFENVAYFEPNYLKEFYTTARKKDDH